jgi:SOS-response transcriptional repressor LexA
MNANSDRKLLDLCAFVDRYWRQHGYGPATRDMQEAIGTPTTSTAHYHVKRGCELGWLVRAPGRSRTVRLTELGRTVLADRAAAAAS